MQNDFEKDISQRMQDFSIAPQPEIWQQVEAALPPEKKRRRAAFWWWLLPLAVLLGGGIWLAFDKQPGDASKEKSTSPQTTIITNDLSKKTQVENPVDTPSQKLSSATIVVPEKNKMGNSQLQKKDSVYDVKGTVSTNKTLGEIQSSASVIHKKRLNYRVNNFSKIPKQITTSSSVTRAENKTTKQQPDPASGELEKELKTYTNITPLAKPEATITQQVPDTIPVLPAKQKIATDSTDSVKNNVATTITPTQITTAAAKKGSNKKSRSSWIAEVGLGQSWQRQSLQGSNQSYYSPVNSTGPLTGVPIPGSPSNYGSLTPPTAAFSFSAGITRKQAISQHWNWQIALRYQMLSTKQEYGSRRDSLAIYYALDAARISSAYIPGSTLVYHNHVHQVQLVPRIEYTINPASHFPISFHTGFSLAYNISSNQLLQDYRTYNYVRSSVLSTKWMSAAEVGATVFLNKKLYAGLLYQHGFSNVAKPALQSNYRWRQWQVRLGLPLFNHSSK